jgi:hypothetical protein
MVKEIIVVKVPREDAIVDKTISFPPLQNLHLELMEIKRKLKKGLPAITIKKPIIVPSQPKPSISSSSTTVSSTTISSTVKAAATAAIATKAKPLPPIPSESKEDTEIENEDLKDIEEEEDRGEDIPDDSEGGVEEELPDDEDKDMLADLTGDANEGVNLKSEDTKDSTEAAPDNGATTEGEVPAETNQEIDPYEGLSPEEKEAKEKEEYIWRFRILKKQYKEREIPAFNEHDDLTYMKNTYERTVKEIHLETSVDSYKTYLIGGFMAIEFVCTNFIGIDMAGFSGQQMLMMDKYERMLIELGERSYTRWGTNIPIELKLVGFILLQAGIFYLGKIIASNGGQNVAMLYAMMTGQPVGGPKNNQGVMGSANQPHATAGTGAENHKKMRGPSIKVAELRKKVEEHDD